MEGYGDYILNKPIQRHFPRNLLVFTCYPSPRGNVFCVPIPFFKYLAIVYYLVHTSCLIPFFAIHCHTELRPCLPRKLTRQETPQNYCILVYLTSLASRNETEQPPRLQ